jgi:hypothetical protein
MEVVCVSETSVTTTNSTRRNDQELIQSYETRLYQLVSKLFNINYSIKILIDLPVLHNFYTKCSSLSNIRQKQTNNLRSELFKTCGVIRDSVADFCMITLVTPSNHDTHLSSVSGTIILCAAAEPECSVSLNSYK